MLPVEEIMEHIKSFNPIQHHYRYLHAPKRLYLSCELTILSMHADFTEKTGTSTSYESYRQFIKQMNISFTKLGAEECETCDRFTIQHDPSISQEAFDTHKSKYTTARRHYQSDANRFQCTSETIYYSVDMEKVIQLPHLPCYKSGIFTSRLTVFNETFVPLGSSKLPIYACVWHEGISGRNAPDLVRSTRFSYIIEIVRE